MAAKQVAEAVTDVVFEEVVEDVVEEQRASGSFEIGLKFKTYEELSEKVDEYEKANMIKLWKRDSRTVQSVKKRLDRPLCPEIKFYNILYSCIHGGRKFKARGEGKRATQ